MADKDLHKTNIQTNTLIPWHVNVSISQKLLPFWARHCCLQLHWVRQALPNKLLGILVWCTASFFWPSSLHVIQTAAGCIVFYHPEFLHVTLPLLYLRCLPVVAHFRSKTRCTRLQTSAYPHPSRPCSVRGPITSQSMPCTKLMLSAGLS